MRLDQERHGILLGKQRLGSARKRNTRVHERPDKGAGPALTHGLVLRIPGPTGDEPGSRRSPCCSLVTATSRTPHALRRPSRASLSPRYRATWLPGSSPSANGNAFAARDACQHPLAVHEFPCGVRRGASPLSLALRASRAPTSPLSLPNKRLKLAAHVGVFDLSPVRCSLSAVR